MLKTGILVTTKKTFQKTTKKLHSSNQLLWVNVKARGKNLQFLYCLYFPGAKSFYKSSALRPPEWPQDTLSRSLFPESLMLCIYTLGVYYSYDNLKSLSEVISINKAPSICTCKLPSWCHGDSTHPKVRFQKRTSKIHSTCTPAWLS